jgi:tRNA(fMet)-specific endonuclease VapC
MTGKLLDTNIIIAAFAQETAVQSQLAAAADVFVPTIALGELYHGARQSGRAAANLARVDQFAANSTVLGCDAVTAQHYGEIRNALRLKGRPIPENDIWIAAIAVQHQLTLVTRDAHFSAVDGLLVEKW